MTARPMILAATVLVFLASCKSGGDEQTTTTGAAAPTSSAPPTSTAPTTTVVATTLTTAAPVAVGEDLDAIVRALAARVTQVARQPDLASLDGIYTAEANVRPNVEAFVKNLITCGCRYDDDGTEIVSTSVVSRAASNVALVQVVTRHGPQRVVDVNGKVVQQGEGWAPRREQWQLTRPVREPDQPWKIHSERVIGPA